jgi:hypothetical protein
VWIELLPMRIYLDPPPKGVQVIRWETPLTPADGMLLLVGAELFVEDRIATSWTQCEWASDARALTAMAYGRAAEDCRAAMWRIRKEQLDAYLAPHPEPFRRGGPMP